MKKNKDEGMNEKTFQDLTEKSWFWDGENIKIGDNFARIMANEFQVLEVKEVLHGEPVKTWKIVQTQDGQFYLIKTSKELV
jgi:hypothetical protein